MNLPEHDKLRAIQPKSQAIGEFLEWCDEQGLILCRADDSTWRYTPQIVGVSALLAAHFGIDLAKLEQEKRAILDEQRALNASESSSGDSLGETR